MIALDLARGVLRSPGGVAREAASPAERGASGGGDLSAPVERGTVAARDLPNAAPMLRSVGAPLPSPVPAHAPAPVGEGVEPSPGASWAAPTRGEGSVTSLPVQRAAAAGVVSGRAPAAMVWRRGAQPDRDRPPVTHARASTSIRSSAFRDAPASDGVRGLLRSASGAAAPPAAAPGAGAASSSAPPATMQATETEGDAAGRVHATREARELEELADEVARVLARQVSLERERRGLGRWP
jgi:hypothetical protein